MLDVTASAKPAAPKTVTTKHLAYALAEQHQLGKKQSLEMMEEFVGMITKHLKKGERVKIAGLGILVVRNRAARMGRNPMTGEPIQIKASKKVAFRDTKELKRPHEPAAIRGSDRIHRLDRTRRGRADRSGMPDTCPAPAAGRAQHSCRPSGDGAPDALGTPEVHRSVEPGAS